MEPKKQISRREVLAATTALGSFTFLPAHVLGRGGALAPSEKLNIAFIGVGGRGSVNIENLKHHNIVGFCDVDWRTDLQYYLPLASKVIKDYPGVKRFDDYRKMLQELDKSIDAVVVSTPDHTHAVATMMAMKMRKHVYCEKPLAHSINEIRALTAAARKYKVATQVGNQGHSTEDIRLIVEWIRDGAIGTVKEVRLVRIEGKPTAREEQLQKMNQDYPVPQGLSYDLWLGPVKYRPYKPMYLPGAWRDWLAFGTGRLGDHNCHELDGVAWALDLDLPETIEADTGPTYDVRQNTETYPNTSTIRYRFPAKGNRPGLNVIWHCDEPLPKLDGFGLDAKLPNVGGVVIGTQGSLIFGPLFRYRADKATPGGVRLYPEELDRSYKRPAPSIPRTQGHWNDWIESCKTGKPSGSPFSFGGMLSETGSLGNIAIRRKGKILHWDAKKMKFTNDDEANKLVSRTYREGWSL